MNVNHWNYDLDDHDDHENHDDNDDHDDHKSWWSLRFYDHDNWWQSLSPVQGGLENPIWWMWIIEMMIMMVITIIIIIMIIIVTMLKPVQGDLGNAPGEVHFHHHTED